MEHYWDSTSIPTTTGPQLLRLPTPSSVTWEYAVLSEELYFGGQAQCEIIRPNAYNTMQPTGIVVLVHNRITALSLVSGTYIIIAKYFPMGSWDLLSWHGQE